MTGAKSIYRLPVYAITLQIGQNHQGGSGQIANATAGWELRSAEMRFEVHGAIFLVIGRNILSTGLEMLFRPLRV